MDADVERFFEECRADPRYRQQPEVIGAMIDAIEESSRNSIWRVTNSRRGKIFGIAFAKL